MALAKSPRLDPSNRVGDDPQRLIRAFSSEAGEIHAEPQPVKPRMAILLLTAGVVALIGISAVFDIDRVVESTEGQVISAQPTIALQALDASIIKSIDVEEGRIVKPGDLLETLDPTFTTADAETLRIQIASLDAIIARDEAELARQPLRYPPSGTPFEQKYRALQMSYHEQRMRQYNEQITAFDEQIALAHATMDKMTNDAARLEDRRGSQSGSRRCGRTCWPRTRAPSCRRWRRGTRRFDPQGSRVRQEFDS